MLNQSTNGRGGVGLSPLMIITAIFVALCVVEGLLVARFWIQLVAVNASDGLQALVLNVSEPLVAPFSDVQETAGRSVGSFDRDTLIAAMAYLVVAIVLVMVTMLLGGMLTGSAALTTRHRRNILRHLDQPLLDRAGSRLLGTASLNLTPDQAERALRLMRMDRYDAELYVIPVAGGCVVAAFASASHGSGLLRRFAAAREAIAVKRAFRDIERRFRTAHGSLAGVV